MLDFRCYRRCRRHRWELWSECVEAELYSALSCRSASGTIAFCSTLTINLDRSSSMSTLTILASSALGLSGGVLDVLHDRVAAL